MPLASLLYPRWQLRLSPQYMSLHRVGKVKMQFAAILLVAASLASNALAAECNADNCLRAAIGTAKGLQSARMASCTSFAQCIVTPAPVYVYDSEALATATNTAAVTSCPSAVPSTASACSGAARYSSACSCGGVTPTMSMLPAATSKTPSNYYDVIIEGILGRDSTSPPAFVGFGAVGLSQNDPWAGIVMMQEPGDESGAGVFRFSSNETADPTFNFFGQHNAGGPGTAPGKTDQGDALFAYTYNCAATGGCVYVRCRRGDGPGGPSDNVKYLQCVGAQPTWTQMYLCSSDDSVGYWWNYLFLGVPGASLPSCSPVQLRMKVLPKNPYNFKKKRDEAWTRDEHEVMVERESDEFSSYDSSMGILWTSG